MNRLVKYSSPQDRPRVGYNRCAAGDNDWAAEVVLQLASVNIAQVATHFRAYTTTSSLYTDNGILRTNTPSPVGKDQYLQADQHKMAVLTRGTATGDASAKDPAHLRRPQPSTELQTRHEPGRLPACDKVHIQCHTCTAYIYLLD